MHKRDSVVRQGSMTVNVVRTMKGGQWLRIMPGVVLGLFLAGNADGAQSSKPETSPPAAVPHDSKTRSARAQAPFDPTGYWVSLITRDWRFRMVVPIKGDYAGIPLSLKGKQFADAWEAAANVAAGKQCEAYGAGAIMLNPGRLHISWRDDDTLKLQTDAGMQTRLLHFGKDASTDDAPSLQGYSLAQWKPWQPRANWPSTFQVHEAPVRAGSLEVSTTRMLQGLIRKNGVAYSDESKLTEYWEQHTGPNGVEYLIVTSVLVDPVYLRDDYRTMAIFQKEPNGSKWDPTPCSLTSAP